MIVLFDNVLFLNAELKQNRLKGWFQDFIAKDTYRQTDCLRVTSDILSLVRLIK